MDDDTRAAYDAVARRYAEAFDGDLDDKLLDRALLGAFAEMCGPTPSSPASGGGDGRGGVADLGCGPGFEARFLADRGLDVTGVDLSAEMVAEARRRHGEVPGLRFVEGSLLALPLPDGALSGATALYSIIHLEPDQRPAAFAELARVLRPGGVLLVAFHVADADHAPGTSRHLGVWFDQPVQLVTHFLAPEEVVGGLEAAGFALLARMDRVPLSVREYPSRRCSLLLRRAPA